MWLNLEASFGLLMNAPRRFAEFLGTFLSSGASDRLIFASGCALAHPLPIIEAFLGFQMPEDLVEGFGAPQLTADMKKNILGHNLLRLHGIDVDVWLEKIAGDQWSRTRKWRSRLSVLAFSF